MKFVINLFLVLAMVQAQAKTLLRFQAHITPHAKYVGHLLLITPDTNNWSKITLDSQARNGDLITKKQIITWLQNKVGTFSYQWQGKNTALIHQITQSKAQDLLNKAQTALSRQLKQQAYEQVELSSKTILKDSDIALADFTVQLPKVYPTAKRVCVRLIYKKDSLPVWFAVKAYQSVLVAPQRIKSHTLIHRNNFLLKKRNIAGLKYPPVTRLSQNIWLKKSINKNHILTMEDLSPKPQIIQGQKVKVTLAQQGISILTEALAQSEGYTGQIIRMKNPRTNKYFTATVTGKNQAEIIA